MRQGGALSIANLVRAYGLSDEIIVKLNESLDGVKDQAVSSGGDLPSTNPAQEESSTGPLAKFGVAKRYRDNDFSTHEDQVMYSCGKMFWYSVYRSIYRTQLRPRSDHGGTIFSQVRWRPK